MKKVELKANKLFINEKRVCSFNYKIQKYILYKNRVLVMLAIPEDKIYNENIFCFNFEGKLLWQIEPREEHNINCPYSGMSVNEGEFTPYKSCGVLCKVNIETGKIISSEFVK